MTSPVGATDVDFDAETPWLASPLLGSDIALSYLPLPEFLAVRTASRGLQAHCCQVAADVVCELRRWPRPTLSPTSALRDVCPTSRPPRWVRAFAQLRAPLRMVAAGGYNSLWNDHEAVMQPEDGDGCENSAEVVCSFGGSTPDSRWRCFFPKMNCQRADMALVKGSEPCTLYAVGGRHGPRRHASVERFDLLGWLLAEETEPGWRHIAPMRRERSGLVAELAGGLLVAAGGRSSEAVLKEVEAYRCVADADESYEAWANFGYGGSSSSATLPVGTSGGGNEWFSLESMRERREYAASSVVGQELWVMGGGESVQGSRTVEVLDLGVGSWRAGPDMTLARYGAGAAEHGGRIYVVGGSYRWGQRNLTTLEALDPREGCWESKTFDAPKGPGLRTSWWGGSVTAHDNYLYLVGGTFREVEESLDSVLIVDLRTMELNTAVNFGSGYGETSRETCVASGARVPLTLQVPRWCGGTCML